MDPFSARYRAIRALTERLAAPLSPEDQSLQSMPEASPVRWHRAHTTWFFETFVLEPFALAHRPFDPRFKALFNSYYEAVGDRPARDRRALLSRPGCEEVSRWRQRVDAQIERLLANPSPQILERLTLGLNHEQQHQEL